MPGTLSSAYACGCLNVRITPVPNGLPSPDLPVSTPDFNQVHVADEGISVTHPQVTLRIRTRGELTSRNRRARYTSLTCLICQVLVYRVHQIVSLDADGRDDWVEQDILKSPSGWIEVHSQCLAEDAIARAEASPQYSALFSLAIPIAASPPASPRPPVEDCSQMSYLAHLPPLFLPPPFTPGHPVFVHLAGQRAAMEHEMAEIMRAKSAQLAHTESRLKRQVEVVWRRFREGLQTVEQLDASSLASPRSPRSPTPRSASGNMGTPASPTISGTPVAVVRDFVPQPVAPTTRPAQARPAISSLSASLVSSGFHHPRAAQQEPTSPVRPASTLSSSSRTLSGSSITLAGSPRAHPTTPARFFEEGRPCCSSRASYQLFQDIDEDMARSKREQRLREEQAAASTSAAPHAQHDAEASRAGPSTVNGNGIKHGVEAPRSAENATIHTQEAEASSVRDKGKGKRKMVTFEPQPAVVTIQRNVNSEKEEEARLARDDGEEMIFELEADGKKGRESAEGAVMVFVEQPTQPRSSQPRRSTRRPPTDSTGLPESFKVLRPMSLPMPSNIIPPRRGPSPPVESSISEEDIGEEEEAEEEEVDEELDSRDQEILKLVAANTPSHRGRWKKDSAEWRTLVSRDRNSSADDDEDDEEQAGMPSSMPLTSAACKPTSEPEPRIEPEPETVAPVPSSSVRRAVYEERDRQRAMDPGALDFAADANSVIEEEDESEDDDGDQGATTSASVNGGGKVRGGRKRALKILQARDDLPDSGMFYSLAS
ncbi:hypothetical protein B0H13DRAFT_2059786 [Mycena leptocephala]|nr:hypothetical protein B0H13DRAFT_2059786 [Mycena leptocephala]